MVYLDRAFCSVTTCTNTSCYRNLSPKHIEEAKKWAEEAGLKDGPLFSFMNFKNDTCGYKDE